MKASINLRSLVGILVFVLALLAPAPDFAQQNDRQPVTVRRPATERLNEYRNSRDYQYNREARPPNSLFGKFIEWFFRKIGSFLTSKSYQNFWQYVFLLAVAGLVIWLLIKANVVGNVFSAPARQSPLAYEAVTENIHEINFDERIDAAIEQRNYRLAVRLLYLQTLKQLTDRNLIAWQPDKTNRSYVYELSSTPYRHTFESLTRQFEYAWYGDFPVSEPQFQLIWEEFNRFGVAK